MFNNQNQKTAVSLPPIAQKHLLCGLAVADLYVQRAVSMALHNGADPTNPFSGLLMSDEHVDRILQQSFGAPIWASEQASGDESSFPWENRIHDTRLALLEIKADAAQSNTPLPLDMLTQRFHLSPTELDCLLIALLSAFDVRYGKLFAFLQDDMTQKRPSINLILDLLTKDLQTKLAMRDLFAPNSTLRRSNLVHCHPDAHQANATFLEWQVIPAHSVVDFLLGKQTVDTNLQNMASFTSPELSNNYGRVSPHTIAQIYAAFEPVNQTTPLFSFVGPYGTGKQEAAEQTAALAKRPLLTLHIPTLIQSSLDVVEGLRLAVRDGRLHGALLHLQAWDGLLQEGKLPASIWALLQTYPHPIVTSGTQIWQPRSHLSHRSIHTIQFTQGDHQIRLETWQKHLGQNGAVGHLDLPYLANQFRFSAGQIEDALATAQNLAHMQQRDVTQSDLLAASRSHSNQKLATLAKKIQPRYQWNDIILPEDTCAQLHEMVQRIRCHTTVFDTWGYGQKLAHGKGLAALFVGESGTGKTMSADIIAGELGLDLYKIDLSSVVSKYIGETEKNLERIFTEAETSSAILFFDEADAIFGKRGEVRDSHDRYANLEVSYLLQRVEAYEGMVILASNLQANIDEAFVRRLSFIIEFPFPDKSERQQIWQVCVPETAPLSKQVDFARLAQFELAGGNIRNITLAAAFQAAAANSPIEMAHLLHATRREHQKLGRLFDEDMFLLTKETR